MQRLSPMNMARTKVHWDSILRLLPIRKNGYSLILDGLEKGINDRARERAIVVHGAAYADPSVIRAGGRLGRSFGCPAVPQKLSRPLIDTIKGGSVMYIYAATPEYLAQSHILNSKDRA